MISICKNQYQKSFHWSCWDVWDLFRTNFWLSKSYLFRKCVVFCPKHLKKLLSLKANQMLNKENKLSFIQGSIRKSCQEAYQILLNIIYCQIVKQNLVFTTKKLSMFCQYKSNKDSWFCSSGIDAWFLTQLLNFNLKLVKQFTKYKNVAKEIFVYQHQIFIGIKDKNRFFTSKATVYFCFTKGLQ